MLPSYNKHTNHKPSRRYWFLPRESHKKLNGGFPYKLYGEIDNYIESLIIIIPVYYFQSTMLVSPFYSEYLQTGTLASSEYPISISSVFAQFFKENQQSPGTNIHKFKDCQPDLITKWTIP